MGINCYIVKIINVMLLCSIEDMDLTMKFIKEMVVASMLIVASGCSSYQAPDVNNSDNVFLDDKYSAQCLHMTPEQVTKCEDKKKQLVLAGQYCNSPYKYLRKRCEKDKAERKKLLDETLKKHIK